MRKKVKNHINKKIGGQAQMYKKNQKSKTRLMQGKLYE